MLNSTPISHFVLKAYMDIGLFKYPVFVFLLLWYYAILLSNLLLIAVIYRNRSLHEPMLVFLCSLFANEVYGSTAVFPLLLSQILSEVHVISTNACFLQIFSMYSYGSNEFNMLAVMSYDRYLAICYPLQYTSRMTPAKIAGLIALAWWYALFMNLIVVYGLTAPLKLCGNDIFKVYCHDDWVVKLSCSDTTANNMFALLYGYSTIVCLISLILYSYGQILRVCVRSSKRARQTAFSTCSPHILSILNFSCGAFLEGTQSRVGMSMLPQMLQIILSLYWLIVQPLASPLVYGLKITKIRLVIRALLYRE